MTDAFFVPNGEAFTPTDRARGPWVEDSLHGRMIAGLVGHVFETRHGDPEFNLTRITIDLVRPTRFDDVAIETNVTREGSRIRVLDASVVIRGEEIAQARAVFLRRGEPPAGEIWSPPPVTFPHPESLESTPQGIVPNGVSSWDMRAAGGRFGEVGRRVIWQRQLVPLVQGVETGPIARIGMAADNTNPWANSGDRGLVYINSDVSLYLHRPAVGEWLCVEVTSHQAVDGVAVGAATLHDLDGPIGQVLVGALANRVRR